MIQGQALKSVQDFKKDVRKEFSALKKNKDLKKFNAKLNAKKRILEKKVKKAVQLHINQANKVLAAKQKELDHFQKTINSLIKKKIQRNAKNGR